MRHGKRAEEVARHIAQDERLRQPLSENSSHLLGEGTYAVQYEAAVTLGDILLRRVPVALTGDWSDHQTRLAAEQIGKLLGWKESEINRQIDGFENERSAFLIRPAV